MDLVNLNINEYTDVELEDIFSLNNPYSIEDLKKKKHDMYNNLINDESVELTTKSSIRDFLSKITDRLEKRFLNNNLVSNNTEVFSDITNSIIVPKEVNSINVMNTPYPDGIVNPIEKKTITKVINIDSLFRPNYDNTNSSEFMWDLLQTETNIVSMRISSADIPITWYSINDTLNRNDFNISLYNMETGGVAIPDTRLTVTIPPGNYMSDTFTNTLNFIFQKQGGGLEYLIADVDSANSKTIIRAMDKDDIIADSTGLTTHAAYDPSNSYYAPNFYFELHMFPHRMNYSPNNYLNEFQRTVGWYMGFRKIHYKVVKTDIIKQIIFDPFHNSLYYDCGIESESSYSSTRDNYIFLSIDDYNRNSVCQPITSSTGNSYIGDNILGRISVNTIQNSVLYDNGSDKIFKERMYMGPVSIEKLKINLINRYGEIIDLNSNNFSFTLELTKLY
jgi:hypothetical protein